MLDKSSINFIRSFRCTSSGLHDLLEFSTSMFLQTVFSVTFMSKKLTSFFLLPFLFHQMLRKVYHGNPKEKVPHPLY